MLSCLKAELAEKSNFLALRGREVLTKTKKRMELTHNYEIMDILCKIISHSFYFTESFCLNQEIFCLGCVKKHKT